MGAIREWLAKLCGAACVVAITGLSIGCCIWVIKWILTMVGVIV